MTLTPINIYTQTRNPESTIIIFLIYNPDHLEHTILTRKVNEIDILIQRLATSTSTNISEWKFRSIVENEVFDISFLAVR